MRAAIVSKRALLFTTPTPVPANLFNRGLPVKLLAILGTGHLTIVTSDPKIKTLADLAGKPVLGFFAMTCRISSFAPPPEWRGSIPTRISN